MPHGAAQATVWALPETETSIQKDAPQRARLGLTAPSLVAGVANLNPSVANVALPDIGKHVDSSQTTLDLVAVGYSLGLAASVLSPGAVGGRYGRKMLLFLGRRWLGGSPISRPS